MLLDTRRARWGVGARVLGGACARTARMRARLARARACHNLMTCARNDHDVCREGGVNECVVGLARGVWRGAARCAARGAARGARSAPRPHHLREPARIGMTRRSDRRRRVPPLIVVPGLGQDGPCTPLRPS